MKFIQGHNRNQINLFPVSLDQSIDPDNEVRIIDVFVDSLSIKDYGFRMDYIENGRPAYHPSDLLDLVRPGIDYYKTIFSRLSVWNIKFPGLLILPESEEYLTPWKG